MDNCFHMYTDSSSQTNLCNQYITDKVIYRIYVEDAGNLQQWCTMVGQCRWGGKVFWSTRVQVSMDLWIVANISRGRGWINRVSFTRNNRYNRPKIPAGDPLGPHFLIVFHLCGGTRGSRGRRQSRGRRRSRRAGAALPTPTTPPLYLLLLCLHGKQEQQKEEALLPLESPAPPPCLSFPCSPSTTPAHPATSASPAGGWV